MANKNGSFAQAAVTGATTVTAPANTVGFILMALDSNTDNLNWSVGSAAASGSGSQLEPGRDTGYVPIGANLSVAPKTGTQTYAVQWILST